MNGIFYRNTQTNIPRWVNNLHEEQALGYAYETDSHFVHIYGKNYGFNVVSVGLTAIEGKSGTLNDWVDRVFGAQDIKPLKLPIGNSVENIWRPSLYYIQDIHDALKIDAFEQRSAEQALRVLIEKLDDLLLYIEPDQNGLKSYGHKSRELLILACTEVENSWTSIFKSSGISPQNNRMFTTNDYVKLLSKARLDEFQITFKNYDELRDFIPFSQWDKSQPTKSLKWYDSYNKTKHDRNSSFNEATLENVLDAVSANIVMFCARFSPFSLLNNNNTLSSLVNQHFRISLNDSDPATYYIPKIELPEDTRTDLLIYDCYKQKHNVAWNILPLVL